MNNFTRLYHYEIKKIFNRKLTVIALIVITVFLAGVNISEYIVAKKSAVCNEDALVGRQMDDSLFDEMRAGIQPNIMTDSLGNKEIENFTYLDGTYRHLFQYLLMCEGNGYRAYNISGAQLETIFNGVIDTAYKTQKLTKNEISYWNAKRADLTIPPLYDKSAGWSNSVVNLYMSNFFILILIGASVSGVFADEYGRKTDAIILSSKQGKGGLSFVKIIAGCSAGLIEAVLVLAINSIVQFILYGPVDANASIQLTYGPSALDMPARKAFLICSGIMLIISVFYSLFTMCISQLSRNTTAPLVLLVLVLIGSMLTPPDEYRIMAQIASYLPATFPGSWTFADYRLLNIFGLKLNILQAMPVIYIILPIILGIVTCKSYKNAQVKSR